MQCCSSKRTLDSYKQFFLECSVMLELVLGDMSHHDGDFKLREILLILWSTVDGHKHIELALRDCQALARPISGRGQ